jgi:Protein of unknown function C-terminus (DUF2399)
VDQSRGPGYQCPRYLMTVFPVSECSGGLVVAADLLGDRDRRRFDTEAYLRAADAARSPQPLAGIPVHASWDPRLGEAMRRAGERIEEELVLDGLLADLTA